jgi:hypothetical protein
LNEILDDMMMIDRLPGLIRYNVFAWVNAKRVETWFRFENFKSGSIIKITCPMIGGSPLNNLEDQLSMRKVPWMFGIFNYKNIIELLVHKRQKGMDDRKCYILGGKGFDYKKWDEAFKEGKVTEIKLKGWHDYCFLLTKIFSENDEEWFYIG